MDERRGSAHARLTLGPCTPSALRGGRWSGCKAAGATKKPSAKQGPLAGRWRGAREGPSKALGRARVGFPLLQPSITPWWRFFSAMLPFGCQPDQTMPSPQPRLVVGIAEKTQQRLRQLAQIHHRSTSGEVAAALDLWIEKHAKELVASEVDANN